MAPSRTTADGPHPAFTVDVATTTGYVTGNDTKGGVAGMRIDRLEVRILEVPLNRPFWMSQQAYTTAGQVFVTLRTTDGVVGYGQAHGNPMSDIAGTVRDVLAPIVLGQSVWPVRSLWHRMFGTSNNHRDEVVTGQPHFGGRGRHQLLSAIAAVDIAIWDARAKLAGQPLWRFLGGDNPALPAYATGGYYPSGDDRDDGIPALLAEVESYVDAGFTAVKIKVGRQPEDDIARVAVLRERFPELRLMVDANGGWGMVDALRAARGFRDLDVFWLEEPLQWHHPARDLRHLRRESGLALASGEQEMHQWAAAALVDEGEISYLQTDCTRAGGLTAWMEAATYAHLTGVGVAPHHDGHIHGHHLTTIAGEKYCETFPNAERDPLWAALYDVRPELKDGQLILNDEPGLGIEPNPAQLDKWTSERFAVDA